MPELFRRIEDEVLACVLNKVNNRKTRRYIHEENLLHEKREAEIKSRSIPSDRRHERVQIKLRLRKKLEGRKRALKRRVGA